MPKTFSLKNKAHFNWLQRLLKKVEIKNIINDELGISYPIFEKIPEENRVSEKSIGLQIIPASEIATLKTNKSEKIDGIDDEIEDSENDADDSDDEVKKRVSKRLQTFRVLAFKNDTVYCVESGAGQRYFHSCAVLVVETDGLIDTDEEN